MSEEAMKELIGVIDQYVDRVKDGTTHKQFTKDLVACYRKYARSQVSRDAVAKTVYDSALPVTEGGHCTERLIDNLLATLNGEPKKWCQDIESINQHTRWQITAPGYVEIVPDHWKSCPICRVVRP